MHKKAYKRIDEITFTYSITQAHISTHTDKEKTSETLNPKKVETAGKALDITQGQIIGTN